MWVESLGRLRDLHHLEVKGSTVGIEVELSKQLDLMSSLSLPNASLTANDCGCVMEAMANAVPRGSLTNLEPADELLSSRVGQQMLQIFARL